MSDTPFTGNQSDFNKAITSALFSFFSEMAYTTGQLFGNMLAMPFEMINNSFGNVSTGVIPGWSIEGSGYTVDENGVIGMMYK
jgi:hypothetical protein